MAIYRNVHVSFWSDSKVSEDMSPEDKYFMLYLLTNPLTNQVGCYQITKRQMAYELGYNVETVDKLLNRLEENLKIIRYSNESKELLILNWYKYNWTTSPKVKACILKELKNIKNVDFRKNIEEYMEKIYGMDRVSVRYGYTYARRRRTRRRTRTNK